MAYIGPSYLGRRTKNDIVTWKFTLTVADVPTTLATSPAVKCYENGSTTEFTGGITLTPDYDSKTGLCELVVDTSNAAYSAGHFYDFVVTAGAIGIVSPVGYVVGHFELIPEPSDLRMVNGGSTGTTAGKIELSQGLVLSSSTGVALNVSTSASAFPSASFTGGAATGATYPAGPGIAINGGNADTGTNEIGGAGIEISGGSAFGATSKHAGPAILLLSGAAIGGAPDAEAIFQVSNLATGNINGGPQTAGPLPAVLFQGDAAPGLFVYNSGTTGPGALRVTANGSDGIAVDGGPGGSGIRVFGGPASGASFSEPALYLLGGLAGSGAQPAGAPAIFATGGYADHGATGQAGPGIVVLSGTDFQSSGPQAPPQAMQVENYTSDWVQAFWGGPFGGNVTGLRVGAQGTGKAISALGQVYVAPTNTNDDAIKAVGNGTGKAVNGSSGTITGVGAVASVTGTVTANTTLIESLDATDQLTSIVGGANEGARILPGV